jgi:hypothetical protein
MSTHEIPELDTPGLRRFGLIFAVIIAGLFGVLFPLVFGAGFAWWPWIVGAFFAGWSLLAPATLNGFYHLWMRFGLVMNAIVTRVVLGFVYYVVILPTGLIMRLRGKDPMQRRTHTPDKTYRVESTSSEPEQMRKPF